MASAECELTVVSGGSVRSRGQAGSISSFKNGCFLAFEYSTDVKKNLPL